MEPISMLFLAGVIAATSTAAFVVGVAAGNAVSKQIKEEEKEDGKVHVSFEYTAHPEQFIDFLEKDLALLKDDDRVTLRIRIDKFQGWSHLTRNTYFYENINGRASDMIRVVKTILLDDNSPLITRSSYKKNTDAWGHLKERYGTRNVFYWTDSNSPLRFTVSGVVTSPVSLKEENEDEVTVNQEMLNAVKEVERLDLRRTMKRVPPKKISQ